MKLLVEDNPIKVIEFVKQRLIEQKYQSINTFKGETKCAYRGTEGRKCAAGHLIPDSEYSPSFENQTVLPAWWVNEPNAQRDNSRPISRWFLENYPKSYRAITALQSIHDSKTNANFTRYGEFAEPFVVADFVQLERNLPGTY